MKITLPKASAASDPFESGPDISGFLFGNSNEQPVPGDDAGSSGHTADPFGCLPAQPLLPSGKDTAPGKTDAAPPTRGEATAFFDAVEQAVRNGGADEETAWNHAVIRKWLSRFDDEATLAGEYERVTRYLPEFGGKAFSALSEDEKTAARGKVEREYFTRSYEEFLKETEDALKKDKARLSAASGKNPGLAIANDLAKVFASCTRWIMTVFRQLFNTRQPDDMDRVFASVGSHGRAEPPADDEGDSPSP